jgi:transposase
MAMIINGLGFVSRPTMLTPQFFETKPMDILIGPHITPESLNRHKLGRVLDAIFDYGCEKSFNQRDGGVPFVMRPWSGNKSDSEAHRGLKAAASGN